MQDEDLEEAQAVLPDPVGRGYLKEKLFTATVEVLAGVLTGRMDASDAEIKRAVKTAVTAAKYAVGELIDERIL